FWSFRFRTTSSPALTVCTPFTQLSVSLNARSVVGDSSDALAPLKLAKPLTVTFGMLFSKRPPFVYSCGNANPYVSRIHVSPTGGARWPFHEAFALASFTRFGLIVHACPICQLRPGRRRSVGTVGSCELMNVPPGSIVS